MLLERELLELLELLLEVKLGQLLLKLLLYAV